MFFAMYRVFVRFSLYFLDLGCESFMNLPNFGDNEGLWLSLELVFVSMAVCAVSAC